MKVTTPSREWDIVASMEFWNRVELYVGGKDDSCWEWRGTRQTYGVFTHQGLRRYAHRDAYEHQYGPVPDGLFLDHLCRNTICVRPDHLEPVTARVNSLRSESVPAKNARKTACHRGHPFTAENTYMWRGKRTCRECRRTTGREWYRAQKEQA